MHWLLTFTTIIAAGQTTFATPWKPHSPHAVKEAHVVPRGWHHIGIPHPDHIVNLKIGLKNKNFGLLERNLFEVSDPSHARYGNHLSRDDVAGLVKPDSIASSKVYSWLEDNGVASWQTRSSKAGDWITLSLPVSKIEAMLDTKYATYKHDDGDTLVRTTKWSLPENLHRFISTIQPTTAFMRASPKLSTVLKAPLDVDVAKLMHGAAPNGTNGTGPGQICNFEAVTPDCLRALYGFQNYTPQSAKSHIGFTNYLGEVTNRSDTSIFLQRFRPEAVSSAQTFEQVSIKGGPVDNGTAGAGYEGNLDIQTISGLVYPINITSYSTGGSPPFTPDKFTPTNTNEPYLDWLDFILAQSDLPQVISTSYGDDEQTVPPSYAQAVCEGFAQLGLRGVSVLFSAGDNGVGANGTCITNDGKNTTQFLPAFPASCPYVTTVGGTRSYPEIVAYDTRNGYASGAGFSNYFEQPKYQKDSGAVDKYVASLNGKFDGLYNKSGRAYPDISTQGYRYVTIYNGSVVPLDGTSCSSPTAASIISLLNDALLEAGKSPLGFLNPWLYSGAGAQGFTDVVQGSAIGCDDTGFVAGKGWDAASGWGTPKFPQLMAILGMTDGNGGWSNGTGPSTHWRRHYRA